MTHDIYTILQARSRCLLGAGPAFCYVGLPSPSSAESVYPPWCTLSANLQEVQTSLVPPVPVQPSYYQTSNGLVFFDRNRMVIGQ